MSTSLPAAPSPRSPPWGGTQGVKSSGSSWLLGCVEEALIKEGIDVRHITQGRNVPMFKTNIQTKKAGPFYGPMVCSMRPMTPENAKKAYDITVKMPNVHGAPVCMGDPAEVGAAFVERGSHAHLRQTL